jgi:hypothetical protein
MTVGTVSGDSEGDAPGDVPGNAAGIRAGSPCSPVGATPLGGHFWVLADVRSDEEEENSPISDQSWARRYVSNSYLSDCVSSSARRLRRDCKRRMQRWAAKELAISPSAVRSPSSPEERMRQSPGKKLPVLEPSTFILEEFNASEWITVFRRERKKIARSSHQQSSFRHWPDNAIVYSRRKKKRIQILLVRA